MNFNFNLSILSFLSVNHSEISAIAQGISDVIDEIFSEIHLDFYPMSDNFSDLTNDILVKSSGKYTFNIHRKFDLIKLKKPGVILTNSESLLNKTLHYINPYSLDRPPIYPKMLVYCEKSDFESYMRKLGLVDAVYSSYKQAINQHVIVNHQNNLTFMANFIPKVHYRGAMFKFRMQSVSSFDKKSLKWNQNFDKLKIREFNFKNYSLCVRLMCHSNYDCYDDLFDEKPRGVLVDICNIVGKRGDFEAIYENLRLKQDLHPQPCYLTLVLSPSLRSSLIYEQNDFYTTLTPYTDEKYRFIITPAESYTSYEKLAMPFDETTWMILLITFLTAFITIVIVNQLPRHIQNIIYGLNVKMPGYNVISIFFGIGQTILPIKTFPRFILMLFIIFCLIFRTAYQGVLYELITTDVQKALPTKIIELLQQNYTFHQLLTERHGLMSLHLKLIMKENNLNTSDFYHDDSYFQQIYLENYRNQSAKLAFYADEKNLNDLNKLCNCSNLILDEVLFSYPTALGVFQNHFLIDLFEDTMQKIIPFGIPQHFVEFHRWIQSERRIHEVDNEPKVFTIEALMFGFVLWFAACGISFIGFIMELMHIKLRRHVRTLVGCILFFMLLRLRLKSCAYM